MAMRQTSTDHVNERGSIERRPDLGQGDEISIIVEMTSDLDRSPPRRLLVAPHSPSTSAFLIDISSPIQETTPL
jgi:hypothetical protein